MLLVRRRAIPAANVRVGVTLIGTIDGVNTVFAAPEAFVQTTASNIAVYLNGQRLYDVDDYTVSGGGTGEGTTVTVLSPPEPGDKLRADYLAI